MRLRSLCVGVVLGFCGFLPWLFGSEQPASENDAASAVQASSPHKATSSSSQPAQQPHFTYVGTFTKRGNFRDASTTGCLKEAIEDDPNSGDAGAPPWMLHSREVTIPDFDSPTHGRMLARQRSRFAGLLDPVVQSVYGGPVVLRGPKYLAIDSRNRVIASDPADHSVHVLDPAGKDSFRILAGREYRLKAPEGVATDQDDNIYIADSHAAVVFVYDRHGAFLRKLGLIGDENLFEHPTAIAIDKVHGCIYLADTPRNIVVLLDLQGRVIKEFGRGHSGKGEPDLRRPSAIAVNERGVAIEDSGGTRVWLLEAGRHAWRSFPIAQYLQGADEKDSIALDAEGNIYASSVQDSLVIVVNPKGELLGSFGQPGMRRGEFQQPTGLWLSNSGELYVADSLSGRVQVFRPAAVAGNMAAIQ